MLTIFILFTSLYIISANADSTPCNKDIGILIDTSLSIPQRKLEVLLETFLKPFYDKFEISAQKTQFGLITFDKYSRLRFTLADNISTIEPVRHFMTRIDLALLQAKNELFTSSAGDRKDKQNVLLVITDGKPFPAKTFLLFKKSLALLRAQNVNIFAVGYGVEANINTTVLKEIGGDNVLIMNEDKTLGYSPFVDPIKNMVCIPDPVAFFPLNAAYGTKEINNRAVKGIPRGVTLAPGPDGRPNHSYKFSGSSNSYIEFPNRIGGPLDVRYSMTMLCWVYYGKDGPLFSYEKGSTWGVHLWVVHGGKLFVRFVKRDYSSTNYLVHTNLAGGWKFVGASYDRSSGEAKLWVNGAVVQTLNIGAGLELATQDSIRMGVKTGDGRYFKGRIAQMRIYNRALTQEQIQAIQKLVVAA